MVPVLSVQRTVAEPSVSMADGFRKKASAKAIIGKNSMLQFVSKQGTNRVPIPNLDRVNETIVKRGAAPAAGGYR
jgi:hypothetical protein